MKITTQANDTLLVECAAEGTTAGHVVAMQAGSFVDAAAVVSAAVDADTVLTLSNLTTSTTLGTITLTASGSAAGSKFVVSLGTDNRAINAGDVLKVVSDGAATGAVKASVSIMMQRYI